MQIILKSMSLVNFRGIKNRKFDFNPDLNIIRGDNQTGKTTLLESFLWCLFGKDSYDRKDFELKYKDADGNTRQRANVEVEVVLSVDEKDIELKRIYKEKWVTKRGSEECEFIGHETEFYWNDVPLKMSDFNERLSRLIDERLFKLISNVPYFNSLHWEKRREILFELAGDISETDILKSFATLGNKDQVSFISNILNADKSLSDAKAEYANKKKKVRESLKDIPARIDEAERSKLNPVNISVLKKDKEILDAKITAIEKSMDELDLSASSKAKELEASNEEYNHLLSKFYELKRNYDARATELVNNIRSSHVDPTIDIQSYKKQLTDVESKIVSLETRIESLDKKIEAGKISVEDARKQWFNENEKTLHFDDHDFNCPTCKRSIEPEDIEIKKKELTANFNKDKTQRLFDITERGKELKSKLEDYTSLKDDLYGERDTLQKSQVELKDILSDLEAKSASSVSIDTLIEKAITADPQLKIIQSAIDNADKAVKSFRQIDNSEFMAKIQAKKAEYRRELEVINQSISEINNTLGSVEYTAKLDQRIQELKESESVLNAELSELEGMEYAILQYEKARVQFIENRINGLFEIVSFKMFETQINGYEIPCCITLRNGVPYDVDNNASRINAGLDIINALSKHYDVYAPIFIDNAESSNNILPVNAQLIRLEVSHDPELVFVTADELESVTN